MLGAETQHIGRIFVDNTERKSASIAPHSVLNLLGGYRFMWGDGSQIELGLRAFNVTDAEYETSGYMDYDAAGNLVPLFIPAAKRNFLAQVRVDF
jgi:outer membrane receptor protein involved in Fe transport